MDALDIKVIDTDTFTEHKNQSGALERRLLSLNEVHLPIFVTSVARKLCKVHIAAKWDKTVFLSLCSK